MATYTKPTISNYNDNPPSNDGSTSSFVDNGVDWDRHIDEIGDPLNSYSDAINNETSSSFDKFDESIYKSVKKDYNATGDGATDDTLAIQAAIDSGQSLYFPPGIYKVSSTLNLLTVNNHGQILRGAGSLAKNGSGGDLTTRTIIRPTSAVTEVFKIDGDSFSNFVQHFRFADMTVDLGNMTDVAASCAFNQIHAWGGDYTNVRMLNEGSNKRGWIFEAGAFTTILNNCSARIYEATGISDGDQVTTLTFLGCDSEQFILNYASAIVMRGGACQGTVQKFDGYADGVSGTLGGIYHVTGMSISGLDVEGTGDYIKFNSNNSNAIYSFGNQITGLSGAIYTGTPSFPYILEDTQGGGSNPFFRSTGEFKMWNSDSDADSFFLSGGATSYYNISIGRTAADMTVGVAGATDDITAGSAQGDGVITASQLLLYGGKHRFANQMGITRKVLTYSASIAVDLSDGNEFEISPDNSTAFTINNPTNTLDGQQVTFRIRNSTGGALGTITWGSAYSMATWTNPGTTKSRAITFQVIESDGLHEITRTENDIPL